MNTTSFSLTSTRRRGATGFTLIEMLVAASLIGLVLVTGAAMTSRVGSARTRVDALAAHHAEADAALRAVTTALRQRFRNTGEDDQAFVGLDDELGGRPADRLRFFTVSHRVIRPGEPESDVHEVEFYLEPQNGEPYPALLRRTDPTRNAAPDGGGVIELVARGVGVLDFEYYDGERWTPDWPEFLDGPPVAVRVTIGVAVGDAAQTLRPYRRLIHFPMMPEPGVAEGSGAAELQGPGVIPGAGAGAGQGRGRR